MIDNDIFQIVTLVLLLLALVVSLVSLSTLGKMRKEMEARGPDAVSPGTPRSDTGAAPSAGWGAGTGASTAAPAAEPVAAHPLETAAPAAASGGIGAAGAQATAQPTAAAAEPQDQPFERDGRWWFKRGDELLVYDEGTGQWQPAPAGAGAGAAADAGGTAQMPAVGGGVATQEVGAHWKCPTCGAVNGSTATSCRMCFTARP